MTPRLRLMRRRLAARDGFTLIEVLIATLILTVGILGGAKLIVSSEASTVDVELQQVASAQGERALESVRALDYDEIGYGTAGSPGGSTFQAPDAPVAEDLVMLSSGAGVTPERSFSVDAGTGGPPITGTVRTYVTWRDEECTPLDLSDLPGVATLKSRIAALQTQLTPLTGPTGLVTTTLSKLTTTLIALLPPSNRGQVLKDELNAIAPLLTTAATQAVLAREVLDQLDGLVDVCDIDPADLDDVKTLLEQSSTDIATLATQLVSVNSTLTDLKGPLEHPLQQPDHRDLRDPAADLRRRHVEPERLLQRAEAVQGRRTENGRRTRQPGADHDRRPRLQRPRARYDAQHQANLGRGDDRPGQVRHHAPQSRLDEHGDNRARGGPDHQRGTLMGARDERGFAVISVLLLMVVMLLVTSVGAVAVVRGFDETKRDRSSSEALATADAAIDIVNWRMNKQLVASEIMNLNGLASGVLTTLGCVDLDTSGLVEVSVTTGSGNCTLSVHPDGGGSATCANSLAVSVDTSGLINLSALNGLLSRTVVCSATAGDVTRRIYARLDLDTSVAGTLASPTSLWERTTWRECPSDPAATCPPAS